MNAFEGAFFFFRINAILPAQKPVIVMLFFSIFTEPLSLAAIFMTIFFLVATFLDDNSIVDVGWGIGFVLLSLYTFLNNNHQWLSVQGLMTALVCLWGLRLSAHIFSRNHGKGEDPRYATWRKQWGAWVYIRSFFQVFLLQGMFMMIILSPVLVANAGSTIVFGQSVHPIWLLGLAIWGIGFVFEVVADYQLDAYLRHRTRKGGLLTSGLWKYTRHPNYFGEATMWWGIWIMSLSLLHPFLLYTVISPIVITILLRWVSGVPMTEKHWEKRRGFTAYKERTNAFIPWFVSTK